MAEARDAKLEDELRALATRRWRIAIGLTGAMMIAYFGFLFVVAWAKPLAGALVSPGLSWGILLGVLVIVVAWVVTGVYVLWANSKYDVELARLRTRHAVKASEKADR
jgi:uncharacterized membrane protein (DUF485 family)